MEIMWKIVDDNYLSYLRNPEIESRIPYSDYGVDKFKPFFGTLFEVGNLVYVTQISHPQPRHAKMKQNMDFYKLYHPTEGYLLAVLNLNYMFPIHKSLISNFEYKNIEKFRTFKTKLEKSKYIDLLQIELKEINKLNLSEIAKRIYNLKKDKPQHIVSKRCFDFKLLEQYAIKYNT